ncbi:WUSCHEL-related homeobox 8-like [Ananas comosus]|uniref:WUSCHEL-related homeobox 8-like n=1 Tax=Ananas comosus TaxID=4615 RepID=A0A6P5FF60_ANACO|nr:WUSCHEL-related homeobox 8-like [Ananas comosus]
MAEKEGMNCEASMAMTVMTDVQMEELRRQIAAYAAVAEQLLDMYNKCTVVARRHPFPRACYLFLKKKKKHEARTIGHIFHCVNSEMLTGTPNYSDSPTKSGVHKIPARKRWTPLPKQLNALQGIFDKCRGVPNRKEIKEIALQLSQHGPISEANVSNWFQNRRARMRRSHADISHNSGAEPRTGTSKINCSLYRTPRMDQWMVRTAHVANQEAGSGVGSYYQSNDSLNYFAGIARQNLLQQNGLSGSGSGTCSVIELCII